VALCGPPACTAARAAVRWGCAGHVPDMDTRLQRGRSDSCTLRHTHAHTCRCCAAQAPALRQLPPPPAAAPGACTAPADAGASSSARSGARSWPGQAAVTAGGTARTVTCAQPSGAAAGAHARP
jgi:hypothetical protein